MKIVYRCFKYNRCQTHQIKLQTDAENNSSKQFIESDDFVNKWQTENENNTKMSLQADKQNGNHFNSQDN